METVRGTNPRNLGMACLTLTLLHKFNLTFPVPDELSRFINKWTKWHQFSVVRCFGPKFLQRR